MTAEEKILRTQWGTPSWLFNRLHSQYQFTQDAAALACNAKLPQYLTPEQDGRQLVHWVGERTWCNPPYDRPGPWLEVATQACALGWFSALLLPANFDTAWFDLATQGRIEIFNGRIPHDPPPGVEPSSPRGPQMLVVYSPEVFSPTPRATPLIVRRSAKTGFYLADSPR